MSTRGPRLCLFSLLSLAACGGDPGDDTTSSAATSSSDATSGASGATTGSDATTDVPGPTSTSDATTQSGPTSDATSSTPTEPTSGPTTDAMTSDATSDGTTTDATSGEPPSDPQLPPADAGLDYQLGGAYPPPAGVGVVSRDRNAPPAAGIYNVCYVNGFQSQPDEESFWLDDHPDLVLRDANDKPVIDEDWGEMLLDTRTPEKRAALAEIVGGWISGCAAAGYDAIEIDNLDSYDRSGGLLDQDQAVAFMALLSAAAHDKGMAIAQKNSTELLPRRAEMGTDFAVSEECNHYDECGDYIDAYGDAVLMIEYSDKDFDKGCAAYPQISIVRRDLDLVTPDDNAYVYNGC